MKMRGLILLDFTFTGGFREAAAAQEKMEAAMKRLADEIEGVVYKQCDIKERRGDVHPDITKLKIRTS